MFNFKFWNKPKIVKASKSPFDVCAIPGDGPLFLTTTDEKTLIEMTELDELNEDL